MFLPRTNPFTSIFILRNKFVNAEHFHDGLFAMGICHELKNEKQLE